jgi:RNA polymerase sigma factor (sigma-70 family)
VTSSRSPDTSGDDSDRIDDAALLAAHVDGDPDAFNALVRRHRDRLWAVALRTTGDREEAADALQDGLISAFRRAETFRGDAQVTTWLHRIVVNACLDRMRKRRNRPTEAFPEDEDRAAELAIEPRDDPAEASERRTDVMAALAQLSDDQRAALVLVDMEGYSVEQAALILGCAPGTVKSRCSRGRARLVPLLTQYDPQDPAKSSGEHSASMSRNHHGGSDVQTGVPDGTSHRDSADPNPAEPPMPGGSPL